MPESVAALARKLRKMERDALGVPLGWLLTAALVLAAVAGAYLARLGTGSARLAALAAPLVVLGVALTLGALWRARFRDPRRAIRRALEPHDAELAASLDRAIGLSAREHAERSEADPLSSALAELHLERRLGEVRLDRLEERHALRGRDVAIGATTTAVLVCGIVVLDPLRPVEGLDVWLARDGRAPFTLLWVDAIDVLATPPAYLGRHEATLDDFEHTSQPRGTVLSVRAQPLRGGRELVLTDGKTETAFVDDGSGRVIARWTVGDSTELAVAARFGDTLVYQRDALTVESIPDLAPVVRLAGAPATLRLADLPTVSLAWEASDDHGLKEVALVLRAAGREDRRTLSRPASDAKSDRGAHELSTRDAFLRRSHVPVEITIEAKDDDAVLGPKWGRSASIIVVPPLVGEVEAKRFEALLDARDALVDLAAMRVVAGARAKDLATRLDAEREAQKKAIDRVERVLAESYGDLRVRGAMRRVAAGQLRRLDDGLAKFAKAKTPGAYAELVGTTEDVVLAFDSALRALGVEDAKRTSKRLADVAEEAAAAARAAGDAHTADAGRARLGVALEVLAAAGGELAKLGELGADLGDLTRGGVGRVTRERDQGAWRLAELAALDLAERLRNPDPSVSGGGRAGVESGPPTGGGGEGAPDEGEASEATGEAEASEREIDDLVQRHAEEIAKLEQAMKDASSGEERDRLRELAKEHAKRIRDAVKELPGDGSPDSARGKLAEGKLRAESMASELERGEVQRALEAGKEAVKSLREAAKAARDRGGMFGDDDAGTAERGGNRVEEALSELERALEAAKSASKERAKEALRDIGKNEQRLAERTGDLKRRGERGDSSMPEDVLEKLREAEETMRDAQRALEAGDVDRGKDKQREAQRLLEMARRDEDPRQEGEERGEDGGDKRMAQETDVPDKDGHKGPEAFRKRVLEGLGDTSDARLREAIKRYAEGLLR